MNKKQPAISKKDLLRIKKIFTKEVTDLVKELRQTYESNKEIFAKNKRTVSKIDRIALKMEKITIQHELLYETYQHSLELLKVYQQRLVELEKRLKSSD